MTRTTLQSALCLCLAPMLVAQQAISDNPGTNTPAKAATITLRKGTVVALAAIDPVSSATAQKGQMVRLALAEDVIVNGIVVIRRGAPAVGVVKSVSEASGKHDGDLQIKLLSLAPQGMSPVALQDYTPPATDGGGFTDSDGFCGGFAGCLLVFIFLVIPYWTVVGIVHAVKAPFQQHDTPVAGKDLVLSPCSEIWGKTAASSQISIALPALFQPSQAAIDFDAVCLARGPSPSR